MDCIAPGGVNIDLNSKSCEVIYKQIVNCRKELTELYQIFEENSSFHDRIKTTGILSAEQAINTLLTEINDIVTKPVAEAYAKLN